MNKREKITFNNLFDISVDIEPVDGSRHAAAVMKKGGKIYGMGINVAKTDPMQQRFCETEGKAFIHAEMLAIKRAIVHLKKTDLSACTLIVVRSKYNTDKEDVLGMSKPCEACAAAIKKYGIKKVIYSTDDGYGVILNE